MAYTVIQAREPARALEQHLEALLNDEHVLYNADIASALDEFRDFCASKLLDDIEKALDAKIDERLWKVHQTVNARFRSRFAKLSRAKLVERRKLNTDYLRFLKAAQRFFRKYILNLYNTYGLPELAKVARKVDKATVNAGLTAKDPSAKVQGLILNSCHSTLIQLGDLSRYRETEVPSKDNKPDWSPAIGYYDLAGIVLPSSGVSAHQLAVLALAEKDHFRTVYHLYRCLVAKEPHPQALPNLKRAFHKLGSLKDTGSPLESPPRSSRSHALRTWYLQAVLECFHGKDIRANELELKLLRHLTEHVQVECTDSTLQKIALTNIAATALARQHFLDGIGEDPANSFLAFLRLTLTCLSKLLKHVQTELQKVSQMESIGETPASRITPVLAHLLPTLRLYASWIFDYASIINGANGMGIESLKEPFWSTLASCLSLFATLFPADQLPNLDYMLDEDVNTVGFLPLHNDLSRQVWYDDLGKLRESRDESSQKDAASTEMLSRIRYILVLGVTIATQDEDIPISLIESKFKCTLSGPPVVAAVSAVPSSKVRPPPGFENATGGSAPHPVPLQEPLQNYQDVRAERMVDELVSGVAEDLPSNIVDSTSSASSAMVPMISGRRSGSYNIQDIMRTFRQSPSSRASPGISPRFVPSAGVHSPSFAPLSVVSRPTQPHSMTRESPVDTPRGVSGMAAAPMTRAFSGRSHVRVNSSESTPSRRSIWTPEPGVDGPVSPGLQSPGGAALGNGTFGTETSSTTPSAMLFGAGNSPWSMTAQERQGMSMPSPSPKSVQWPRSGVQARPFG